MNKVSVLKEIQKKSRNREGSGSFYVPGLISRVRPDKSRQP